MTSAAAKFGYPNAPHPDAVMAGLVPAIHAAIQREMSGIPVSRIGVDARRASPDQVRGGHDAHQFSDGAQQ